MPRRLLPIAFVIAILLACSKKKDEPVEGNTPRVGVDSDPNATYTPTLCEPREGDKSEVVVSESTTNELTQGTKSEKQTSEKRFEYTEHIVKMPPGQPSPTKLTREYKVARKTDFKTKQLKSLSYEGKTVTIERRGTKFTCLVDGKPMPALDAIDIEIELRGSSKDNIKALLPKQGVKIGDTWNVDRDVLKMLGNTQDSSFDMAKSQLTCKLERAYTYEGKQWGSIAYDFDLVVDTSLQAKKSDSIGTGSMRIAGTFDAVIDGSVRDGTMKGTIKALIESSNRGGSLKAKIDGSMMKSVKALQ